MKLFVDTGGLVALNVSRDSHASRARDFFAKLPAGVVFTTSNLVFAETVNVIAARYGQDAAVAFGEDFRNSRLLDDVYGSDEFLERAGLAVMRRFRDKRLSFTDATTIALVKSEGLDGVFGFDQDFVRCGVPLYPRPAA